MKLPTPSPLQHVQLDRGLLKIETFNGKIYATAALARTLANELAIAAERLERMQLLTRVLRDARRGGSQNKYSRDYQRRIETEIESLRTLLNETL